MKYEKTHPWLSFKVNLDGASRGLWMALGEACSKCEHIAGAPLLPDVRDLLHRVFLAKGAQATTAIEGNTLSEEEVRERIEKGGRLPPSREYLGKEIDSVVRALKEIAESVLAGGSSKLTPEQIEIYNRTLLEGATLPEHVIPGEVRSYDVQVGEYTGPPAGDCRYLLKRLCDWLNEKGNTESEEVIATGILKAILAHLYIAWIHPFGDGNGRTARLVEFQILLASGVPTPAAHLLSNHYNKTRSEYYRQLQRARDIKGGCLSFLEYSLKGFVDGLREQVGFIQQYQRQFIWRDFVNWHFKDKHSKRGARQKELVLALSAHPQPVPKQDIQKMNVELALLYADKTGMTVTRDLNQLMSEGLIERVAGGYRARTELVLSLLPPRNIQGNKKRIDRKNDSVS